ncbi:hypothetical protein WS87_08690 [Burkholderia sp. MSMB0856]|uniref:DUF2514 family protein n=1 Tax=Burkholderia sp. MSMB0856 TaxID=1637869 RepID=UPI000857DF4A|nr:DUF2514 family protein [Burkholderia sp. MSMB0856]AOJ86745.1 hypothetical protein WS87_08690 [Burkholderia sp. MSMB0856]
MDGKFIVAVAVAVVVSAAGGYIKGLRDADQAATVGAQATLIRELVAERDESDRIARTQHGNAEDAAKQRDAARADLAAANAARDGLRKQVAELVERARHSAAKPGSPAAGDALDLLADVLGRADQRAGELAKIADERGIAGRQCEADYDALTVTAH